MCIATAGCQCEQQQITVCSEWPELALLATLTTGPAAHIGDAAETYAYQAHTL